MRADCYAGGMACMERERSGDEGCATDDDDDEGGSSPFFFAPSSHLYTVRKTTREREREGHTLHIRIRIGGEKGYRSRQKKAHAGRHRRRTKNG